MQTSVKNKLQDSEICCHGPRLLSNISRSLEGYALAEQQVEAPFTICQAQMDFLPSEYITLLVKSIFDEETGRLFRSFQNNTNVFSASSLSNARLAAGLTPVRIELHPTAGVRKLSRESDANLGSDPASLTSTGTSSRREYFVCVTYTTVWPYC